MLSASREVAASVARAVFVDAETLHRQQQAGDAGARSAARHSAEPRGELVPCREPQLLWHGIHECPYEQGRRPRQHSTEDSRQSAHGSRRELHHDLSDQDVVRPAALSSSSAAADHRALPRSASLRQATRTRTHARTTSSSRPERRLCPPLPSSICRRGPAHRRSTRQQPHNTASCPPMAASTLARSNSLPRGALRTRPGTTTPCCRTGDRRLRCRASSNLRRERARSGGRCCGARAETRSGERAETGSGERAGRRGDVGVDASCSRTSVRALPRGTGRPREREGPGRSALASFAVAANVTRAGNASSTHPPEEPIGRCRAS